MSEPVLTIDVIVPTSCEVDLSALNDAIGRQILDAAELIIVEDPTRRGAGWARNRGIERSHAALVAFLDDDCVPPPNWLESLAKAINEYDAAGAGGTYEEEDPFLEDRRRRQRYPATITIDDQGWVGAGGNVVYRREVLEDLRRTDGHYFDEAFRVSQDKELAWRIRSRGGRLVYVPVRVLHAKWCGGAAYLDQQYGRGVGIAGLYVRAKESGLDAAPDRGLLWANRRGSAFFFWARILLHKAFGPFDHGSFQRKSDFALFWLGEKAQGLGFLSGILFRPFNRRTSPSTQPRELANSSFSIVIESDNLELVNTQELLRALTSLSRQTIAPTRANEVLLINGGRLDEAADRLIRARFPWVTIHTTSNVTDYYRAKSLGVAMTTGDIVVFVDCDVRYEASWLESMLAAFASHPDADVVAGETIVKVSGPYSLAVALTWAFPPPSTHITPYPTTGYAANNVAFRRRVLERIPIPTATGLWRGNCTLHGRLLRRDGAIMLRHPGARAVHPVLPFTQYYKRLWGAACNETSAVILERLSAGKSPGAARAYALLYVPARRCARFVVRCAAAARGGARIWLYFPIALPLALSGLAVGLLGALATAGSWRGRE